MTDIAVICCGTDPCCASPEGLAQNAGALSAQGVRVVLLGARWTRQLVENAIAVGVQGFLVKRPRLHGVSAGILAVFEGQYVLSPELFPLYFGSPTPGRGELKATGKGNASAGEHLLTRREREVLGLLGRGATTQEAASTLHISPATVKSHVSHALNKLGARNRLEAVLLVHKTVHA